MHRLAAVLMALFLAGCACTQIGCDSRVLFHVRADLRGDQEYEVRACVDEICRDGAFGPGLTGPSGLEFSSGEDVVTLILDDGDYAGVHHVTLEIRRDGELIVQGDEEISLTSSQPNGAFCPPTCWVGTARALAVEEAALLSHYRGVRP